ncbi:glycosyltransferase family 2 protein [Cellulosilyticum ruminicola]|uniref:glycosyltransferase family 2 protein n=1 Tax=Cellulosilyticum ruminicola TaxID=425254 RepID=UPI0006D04AD6|nr:glycosyltransferase [Cellulosilyticum ruminicola]
MAITWEEGISIITPTIREAYVPQIVSNFLRQRFISKELILIINDDRRWFTAPQIAHFNTLNIHIYYMPASKTLGECLNMGVEIARYNHIAKFDDDDYYGALYLNEMYNAFKMENCDVVCKQSIFYYLEASGKLMILSTSGKNRRVTRGAGATIGAKKNIFAKIQFAHLKSGTDTDFFNKCRKHGLICYSTSNYNYLCFRNKDAMQHTWQITSDALEKKCKGCWNQFMSYEEACYFVEQIK